MIKINLADEKKDQRKSQTSCTYHTGAYTLVLQYTLIEIPNAGGFQVIYLLKYPKKKSNNKWLNKILYHISN